MASANVTYGEAKTNPGARPKWGSALWSNPWPRFLARRLLGAAIALIALVIVVFLMVRIIPGDPIEKILGTNATPTSVATLRHSLGLDDSLWMQFRHYIAHLVRGDLGSSIAFASVGGGGTAISTLVRQRIGSSLLLAGSGLALVLFVGVPLGMLFGSLTRENRHRRIELMFTGLASVLSSIPDYLSATILAFIFAVQLRVLPVDSAGISGLILPALAVASAATFYFARLTRVETLNVLAQDYIRTARAKRLPWRVIMFRHTLPNILTSVLTLSGLIFAQLIGGTILVETVFNRPGLGTTLVQGVLASDYPVIQAVILLLGLLVICVNLLVDILLGILDPRTLAKSS